MSGCQGITHHRCAHANGEMYWHVVFCRSCIFYNLLLLPTAAILENVLLKLVADLLCGAVVTAATSAVVIVRGSDVYNSHRQRAFYEMSSSGCFC